MHGRYIWITLANISRNIKFLEIHNPSCYWLLGG